MVWTRVIVHIIHITVKQKVNVMNILIDATDIARICLAASGWF